MWLIKDAVSWRKLIVAVTRKYRHLKAFALVFSEGMRAKDLFQEGWEDYKTRWKDVDYLLVREKLVSGRYRIIRYPPNWFLAHDKRQSPPQRNCELNWFGCTSKCGRHRRIRSRTSEDISFTFTASTETTHVFSRRGFSRLQLSRKTTNVAVYVRVRLRQDSRCEA